MKIQHATTKLSIILLLTFPAFESFGQMFVNFAGPSSNQSGVTVDANINLSFTESVDQTTIDNDTPGDFTDDNIRVFGSLSGRIEGTFSGGGTASIVFDPTANFKEGEKIIVYVTQAVQSTTATPVLPSFLEFHVGGAPATGDFATLNAITGTTTLITNDIELGDLDNDGILDLVSATSDGIYVAFGNGSGDFEPGTQETTDPAAFVELADFNLDGLTDMVVATEAGNPYTIDIYLNDGLADPEIFPPGATSTAGIAAGGINLFNGLSVGDFTRDGVPDVIAGQLVSVANAVEIYSVDGATGTFLSTAASAFGNVNAGNFIIGDFDNSGTQDYIMTISAGSSSVNFNNSAGVGDPTFSSIGSGISMQYGKAADFDGNGFIDLAYFQGGFLQVRPGDGTGDFTTAGYSIGNDSDKLAIGDVNGDGQLDIMTVGSSGTRRVYINTGSLTFTQQILSSLTFMSDVELGDLNGDGILDATYATNNASSANRVSLGEAPPALVTVTSDADSGPGSLRQAIADVAPGGTIQFDAGLDGAPIRLSTILLVQKDLTFDGQGQDIILSGDTDASGTSNIGDSRIMSVDEGYTVSFTSMTFEFGFIDGDLGGALILNAGSNVSISECTFRRNTASGSGGAAAAIAVALSNVNIDRCVFEDNTAFEGGGAIYQVANDDSNNTTNIYNSSFVNNQVGNTAGFGGAVAIAGGSSGTNTINATIYNCTFYLNSAGGQGGALLLGNAVNTPSSTHTFTLSNNTFYNNNSTTSNQGDDIYVGAQADLSLYNTLVANDESTAVVVDALGTISASSNNIIAQQPSTFGAINTGNLLPTEILNTSLITGVNGIPVLEILADGPAFDAGTNTQILPDVLDVDDNANTVEDTPIDAAGNPRAWDPVTSSAGTVDIGATESQLAPLLQPQFLDPGFTPRINQTVSSGAVPSIIFDADVDLSSVHAGTNPGSPALGDMLDDNVIVTGEHSGRLLGPFSQISGSNAIDFLPTSALKAGETITISVTNGVLGTGGQATDPFVYQYSLQTSATSPGNFLAADTYAGTTGTQNAAVADLNGDGFLDVFTVSDNQGCRALINDGAGGFTITTVGPSTFRQRAIALGDIDNDGDIDAFIGIGSSGNPAADQIWKNDGTGAFTLHQTLPFSSQIDAVALGDLDGDGDLDAFQNVRNGSHDFILFNDGNGTFTDSGQTPVSGTNGGAVALGDIDNDGDLDAFVGQNSGGADELWINNGDGFFTIYPQTFGTGWANDVVLGDFDGDFDLDVFISTENGENDEIWRNSDGAGNFVQVAFAFGNVFTSGADFGDVDGDGTLDIISPNGIWTNDGGGNFSSFFSGFSGTGTPVASFLADFDNDFDLDPVVIYGDETNFYLNNDPPPFITTWVTSDTQITIPTNGAGFNYNVSWFNETNSGVGNGSTSGETGNYTITGLENGSTYRIEITGAFPHFYLNNGTERSKIRSIEQWGSIVWSSMHRAFWGADLMIYNATDIPDLSSVTDISEMFRDAILFNGNIDNWDVSTIQNMRSLFDGASSFNQPLNGWITTSLTEMRNIFDGASAFNQDLNNWNLSGVTNLQRAFYNASSFNGNITTWDVSNVTSLGEMFYNASVFNQNISGWITTSNTNLSQTFQNAFAFNQPVGSWNTDNVVVMNNTFREASSFDQDLGGWNVQNLQSGTNGMGNMLTNSNLSIANYDATLNGWASQVAAANVELGATGRVYSASGATARATLTGTYGWIITGDASAVPAAPTNFIAYESGGSIILNWFDNANNESSFLIERADDYAFTTNIQDITVAAGGPGIDATTATYDPLGVDYYYRVTAVNGFEDATSRSNIEFASPNPFAGQALSFDGSNYVDVPDDPSIQFERTDAFTIEAWIFPRVGGSYINKFQGGPSRGINLAVSSVNETVGVQIGHDGGASNRIVVNSVESIPLNQWTHVVVTYNGSSSASGVTIYLNGVAATNSVVDDALTATIQVAADWRIGAAYDLGSNLDGNLDEVRIWDDIRTPAELDANRFSPLQGNEDNLVAYYPFDEGVGAINSVDRSRNTNDGTATGGVASVLSDFTDPPAITNAIFFDNDGNGNLDQVRLVFDKAVDINDVGGAGDGLDAITLNDGGPITLDNADYTASGVTQLDLDFLGNQIAGTAVTGITLTYTHAGASQIFNAGSAIEIVDAATPAAFTDNAAPVVVSLEIFDQSGEDGRIDRIDITFSENIDTDDSAAPILTDFGTLLLPDGTPLASGTYSDPDGVTNVVSITVISDQLTSNTTVGATSIDGIDGLWRDANPGNLLTATGDDFETIIDSAPATPVGGIILDSDQDGLIDAAEIQFSEPITDSGVTPGDFTISTDGGGTTDPFDGFSTVVNALAVDTDANDEFITLSLAGHVNVSGTGPALVSYTSTTAILDAVGNPAPNFTDAAPQDGAVPIALRFSRLTPLQELTNADNLTFQVEFSEDVTGTVQAVDFTVVGTSATVTGTSPVSGSVYDVTLGGGNLAIMNGVVGLDLNAGATINDAATNNILLAEPPVDETYTIDNEIAIISSIIPANNSFVTNADIGYTLSEELASGTATFTRNSGTADPSSPHVVALTGAELASGAFGPAALTNAPSLVDGAVYNITIVGVDLAGNTSADGTVTNINFDVSVPTLVSFTRQTPAAAVTNADALVFRAIFSEDVQGVDAADFSVNASTATISNVAAIDAQTYDITVSGGNLATFEGVVGLDLVGGILDLAGNAIFVIEPGTDETYTLDNTDPTVVLSSLEPDPTGAPSFILDVVFSEAVTGLLDGDFVVGNGAASGLTGAGSTYSITITPAADGVVTVDLPAAVAQDGAGNDNTAAAQFSITYDNTDPTVVLSSLEPDPTGAPSFILDVVFSEAVTGLLDGDFVVGNGAASGLTGAGATYSITITPAADGVVTVDLPAAVAQDGAGNDNTAAAQFSITYDNTDPTVVLSSLEPDPTGAPSFILDVVFSEAVTGLLDGDFVVGNGAASGLTGAGATYSITITPAADGLVTVDLPAAVAQDGAGNDNTAAAQFSITYDNTDPTVVLSSLEPDPTGAPSFILDVVFSEVVTGLLDGDFVVGNGAASGLTGAGATYSITITPAADGVVTVDLPAAVAQDGAGNDNTAAAQFSITYDNTDPTVVLSSLEPDPTGAPSFILDVVFSEAVTGLLDGDFVVGNGAASGLTGAGATYSITITPAADGVVTVDLPAAVAQDGAGNDNTAAAQFSITYDNTDPTVVLSSLEPDPTGAPSFILDVVFSEAVTGLLDGDFVVGNGAASGLTGAGATYSITITPAADGLVTVDLPAAVAQDGAGNDNTAAAQFSIAYDNTDPTVVLSSLEPDPTGAPSFILDVVFSEAVTGLLDGDFVVGNGAASGLTGAGATYSITITPAADGLVTVDLPAAVAQDGAGNDNTAAVQFSITYDGSAPVTNSFARQSPLAALTNADVLVFRVSYNEDVTGVDAADFVVDGTTTATITSVTPVNASTYDVQVSGGDLAGFDGTVGLNYNTGLVTIEDLSANALPDTEPATDEIYTLDNSSFSASITRQTPVAEVINAASVTFRVTFTEDVVNVDIADFISTLGTVNNVVQNTSSEYDVTIIGISGDGLVDLDFSGGQDIQDLTTNPYLGAIGAEETYTSDQTDPTVVLSSLEPDPTGAPSFILDVVFSEAVTGLLDGDFVVGNGAASGLTGAGATYSITITPAADGLVTVDLPAAVAQDGAGNDNTAAAQFSITYDNTDPTVVLSSLEPDPTGAPSFILDVVFSEAVTGLLDGDFVVGNGAASGLTGAGATYSITITPAADGLVTVDLPAAVAQDGAGNDNTAAAQFSITYDNTDPTVVLSSLEPDPTGAPSFILDVVFSEAVTGLLDGDFVVGNGAASGLTGAGATYSITITPAADGLVTVDLPAAVAQDGAGNDNTAAVQFSITYDNTDPTVVLSSLEPDPTGAPSFILDVVFSEAVTGLLDGDFVVGNGAASGLTGAGATYSITITPAADGVVTVDLPAAVAQDGAGNDNTTAAQFSITYDNTDPTVVLSSLEPDPTGAPSFILDVVFSEAVTGLLDGDFVVGNGAASGLTGTGATYSITITPAADGLVTVDLPAAVAQDGAGNDNTAAVQFSITYDNTDPSVVLSSLEPDPTGAPSFILDVVFSEAVTGLLDGDFAVGNGAASGLTGAGATYSITITPAADGVVTVDLPAAAAQDGAGNDNTAAVQFSITYDGSAPVTNSFVRQSPLTATTNADILVFRVSYSEDVTGVDVADFVVDGTTTATITSVTPIDGSTYDVQISGGDLAGFDGIVGLNYNTGLVTIQDLSANALPDTEPATDETYTVNNSSFTADIARIVPTDEFTNATSAIFRITFSEDVFNVDITDFTTTIGAIANVSQNAAFEYDVTVNGVAGDGLLDLGFSGGQDIENALTNPFTGIITSEETYTIDNTAPTVVLSSIEPDPTSSVSFILDVIFSEVVIGLTEGDFIVANGAASGLTGSGNTYAITISPAANGLVTVDLPAAVVQDLASNSNLAATQFTITNDQPVPGVTISTGLTDPTNVNPIVIDIAFTEDVIGFDIGDIVVGNGSVSTFFTTDAANYIIDVVPAADGIVTVDIAAGVVQDIDGNDNVAATQFTIAYDATAPVVGVDVFGTSISSPQVTGTIDDNGATISINVAGNDYPVANNGDGTWTLAAGSITPGLTDGTYDVVVTATDAVGNIGTDNTTDELIISQTVVTLPAENVTSTGFTARWSEGLDVQNYQVDVSTEGDFSTFLTGFQSQATNETSVTVTGLDFSSNYYYRVRLVNTSAEVSANSNTTAVKTTIDPETIADSTALRQIYAAVNPQGLNWETARLRTWTGINLDAATRTRVEVVNISGTSAAGDMPSGFTGDAAGGLAAMTTMDASVNQLTGLIDFAATAITDLNVSSNSLQFDDLEPVASLAIPTVDYLNQASIPFSESTGGDQIEVQFMNDFSLSISIDGSDNAYAWYRNDIEINSLEGEYIINDRIGVILGIDYDNMGIFRVQVTNSLVPGLTIDVDPQAVLAVVDVAVRLTDSDDAILTGETFDGALLEAIRRQQGYDTLESATGIGAEFVFNDVVLGDYLCGIDPENTDDFIPTYFSNAFQWDEADTLLLRKDTTLTIQMTADPPELTEEDGEGSLEVIIEEDFDDDGARVDARRRASKRKCGLRRKRTGGRTDQDDEFELIAYGETDENGEFKFGFLPTGTYRFFVEYPGIPIDESSFVEFEVGEAGISDKDFKLQAFANEDGIEVTIEAVLGVILEYFKNLEIYPNPSSDYLNVRYRHLKSQDVTAQLVDLYGNTKWTQDLRNGFDGELRIDVTDFEEGIYFLRFFDRTSPKDNVVTFRVFVKK